MTIACAAVVAVGALAALRVAAQPLTDPRPVKGQPAGVKRNLDMAESPAGEWLVRHGRTIAASRGATEATATERMLIWMEAAGRVSPELAEAFAWQSRLHDLSGRPDAASAALAAYCRLRPSDSAARLGLFEHEFDARQTAVERAEYCASLLSAAESQPADTGSPPTDVLAEVHRRAGELDLARGDAARARAHFDRAVELAPDDLAARLLLLKRSRPGDAEGGDDARTFEQVASLLMALAAQPARADLARELAGALDDLALRDEAARWYRHALALTQRGADAAALARLLVDVGRNRFEAGRFDESLDDAERAVSADPAWLPAHYLVVDAARKLGRTDAADRQIEVLRQRCGSVDPARLTGEPDSTPGAAVPAGRQAALAMAALHAAWFYVEYEPDPARARALAQAAVRVDAEADAPFARAELALAALAAGDASGAAAQVAELAANDQMAAYALARAQMASGRREEATLTLRRAEKLRGSGVSYERVLALLAELGESPRPAPDRTEFRAALGAFDDRILRVPLAPADFVTLTLAPTKRSFAVGEPWRCTLLLTNRGPVPLALGPEALLPAEVTVIIEPEEAAARAVPPGDDGHGIHPGADAVAVQVSWPRRRVLAPGEEFRIEQDVDVAAAARLSVVEPTRTLDFALTAVLDPVLGADGAVSARLGGLPPARTKLRRGNLDPTPGGVAALNRQFREGREPARIIAVRGMAALLAERRAPSSAGAAAPPRTTFDERELVAGLAGGLSDPAPIVRALSVLAHADVRPDAPMINALAAALSDDHWLVRLAALDALSELQGPVFRPVVESLSHNDPEEAVRRLAKHFLRCWAP